MRRLNLSAFAPAFVLLCASSGAGLAGGCGSSAGGAVDAPVDRATQDETGGTGGATGADVAADVTGEMDGGGDGEHPGDACAPSDCPGGTCWQQLNGAKTCLMPPSPPTLLMCPMGEQACCKSDGDCAAPADGGQADNGRCLPRTSPCGGAAPLGNSCHFDQCHGDADCKAQMPAGATVAICAPPGALGNDNASCVYGGCRTDADCTKSPGGRCSYALADTGGACVVRRVLFCAYPGDPCSMASGCSPPTMICVPNDDYQGRRCGKGLPMYP